MEKKKILFIYLKSVQSLDQIYLDLKVDLENVQHEPFFVKKINTI